MNRPPSIEPISVRNRLASMLFAAGILISACSGTSKSETVTTPEKVEKNSVSSEITLEDILALNCKHETTEAGVQGLPPIGMVDGAGGSKYDSADDSLDYFKGAYPNLDWENAKVAEKNDLIARFVIENEGIFITEKSFEDTWAPTTFAVCDKTVAVEEGKPS